MNLLAFAASNSRNSINRQLVELAARRFVERHAPGAEVTLLDLNDYEMPIYSIDREQAHGVPAEATRFLDQVAEADALLISFAEHNGSFTAAFKNVFDWASRTGKPVWQGKPVGLLSTSPGPGGARSVLAAAEAATPFWGGTLAGALSVPSFYEAFDADRQTLADAGLTASLDGVLAALAEHAQELREAA